MLQTIRLTRRAQPCYTDEHETNTRRGFAWHEAGAEPKGATPSSHCACTPTMIPHNVLRVLGARVCCQWADAAPHAEHVAPPHLRPVHTAQGSASATASYVCTPRTLYIYIHPASAPQSLSACVRAASTPALQKEWAGAFGCLLGGRRRMPLAQACGVPHLHVFQPPPPPPPLPRLSPMKRQSMQPAS